MGNEAAKIPFDESRSNTTCRMAKYAAKYPLCVLLIGKTGHGKSATGNSILGRKAFETSSNSNSKTKAVKDGWAEHGLYEIQVVDGPGLEDTDLNAAENKLHACENMATALMKCKGGVHAFLLVIRFGTRFTPEERQTISDLKQIFGVDYLKNHGIIVLTGGDCFSGQMKADNTPRKTFKEWCQKQDEGIYNLIQECGSRVVLFNNVSESEAEKIRQRIDLILRAETIIKKRGRYTSQHFQEYEHARAKLIKESKLKILEETLQKRIDLLSAELGQLSIDSSLKDVDLLDARIKVVYAEIGSESQKEESMQQLLVSLERLSRTTNELRKAIVGENVRNKQAQLEILSREREMLNLARENPWGTIFKVMGVGLAVIIAAVLGGVSIAATGGTSIVALVPMGRVLLGFVVGYLKDKIVR